jgi:hypothetical protein
VVGADLFYAGDWFVLRERYYWLVIDKPNELYQLVLEKKLAPRIINGDLMLNGILQLQVRIFSLLSPH